MSLLSTAWKSSAVLLVCLAVGCTSSEVKRPDGGVGMLPVGATAPDLSGIDQAGAPHKLSDERGHPVVIYFYPKDATPGCTTEACAFRDSWEKYKAAGVQVFGVSADGRASHQSFSKEHQLPFPLIVDDSGVWARAFGVKTTMGMDSRVTFLLGPDGKVAKEYPSVDPGVHAAEVLRDAQALGGHS